MNPKFHRRLTYLVIAIGALVIAVLLSTEHLSYIDIVNGTVCNEQRVCGFLVSSSTDRSLYSAKLDQLKLHGKPEWVKQYLYRTGPATFILPNRYYTGLYFHAAADHLGAFAEAMGADAYTSEVLKIRQMAREGKGPQAEDYVMQLSSRYR